MRDCVVFVGSFTRDVINGVHAIGGPPYYGSIALVHYGCETIMVVSPVEEQHVEFAESMGLELVAVEGGVPVFELRYLNEVDREVKLLRRGSAIRVPDAILKTLQGCVVVASPVYREVDLKTLQSLRSHASVLAVDVQGFVRSVDGGGRVSIRWSDEVYEVVKLADVYHADLSEVPMFSSMREAVEHLAGRSRGIAMVSHGEEGLIASIDGEIVYVPALPGISGNSTGTGDILLAVAAYEVHRGTEPLKAVAMGAVAAGLRVSRDRPPWFNRFEVEVLAEKLVKMSRRLG